MRSIEQSIIRSVRDLIKRTVPEPIAWRYISKLPARLAEKLSGFSEFTDRRFLKSTIFSYLVPKAEFQKILFVGCDWYTKAYEPLFKNKEYWTIEIDPDKKKFGAKKHVVGPLKDLYKHFELNYFDSIICNGVFFKGAMDTPEEAEPSFDQCFRHLRPGGIFVLGWNDWPTIYPYPLAESQSLGQFTRYLFPPIAASAYLTDTRYRHTYTFFTK